MRAPNLLIIMTDEHDPRVSTPYGHPFIATPAMQQLADTGAVFEAAYCNSPLCTPSRASFMTGQHLYRTQVWDNGASLASDQPTWAHRLNAAGYETALAGKMHFVGPDQRHGFTRRLVDDIHGEASLHPADWNTDIAAPHLLGCAALPRQVRATRCINNTMTKSWRQHYSISRNRVGKWDRGRYVSR